MDQIVIRGGQRLKGRIPISGAKNAALTLLPCALLTDEPLTLRNLPRLADVDGFGHLLNQLGCSTTIEGSRPEDFGRVMTARTTTLTSTVAPYDIVRKMRASILVLGPLLARAGEATVSLPGGCAIGNRPIDLHLKALEAFGAQIELTSGYVKAVAPGGRLAGGKFTFPVVSVGATENAVMTAVLAKGTCVLENAAREPEVAEAINTQRENTVFLPGGPGHRPAVQPAPADPQDQRRVPRGRGEERRRPRAERQGGAEEGLRRRRQEGDRGGLSGRPRLVRAGLPGLRPGRRREGLGRALGHVQAGAGLGLARLLELSQ